MYTDEQIQFIKDQKEKGLIWRDIATKFNEKFDETKNPNSVRKAFEMYRDVTFRKDHFINNMKDKVKTQKRMSVVAKENRMITEERIDMEEILEAIEEMVKDTKWKKIKLPKNSSNKSNKKNMTIEPMLSDIHYGLETKTYNPEIARKRMRAYRQVVEGEVKRCSINYNVEMLHVLLNGDIIQSDSMHKDSQSGCCLTNAEQLVFAVESLMEDFILPLALSGLKMKVVCMYGNHDRESPDKFTVRPGRKYYSYTIYRTLELMCKQLGFQNIEFEIPEGAYKVYEIYGSAFLVEHGDLVKNDTKIALDGQINKRSSQNDQIIKGIRIGHFHNDIISNRGRFIVNGSMVSDDHYGNLLGYKSRPCQIINYYVDTKERDSSYYHSFSVDLN